MEPARKENWSGLEYTWKAIPDGARAIAAIIQRALAVYRGQGMRHMMGNWLDTASSLIMDP